MLECMVNGKIRKNKSEIGSSGCSSTVEMTVRYAFRDFKICATRMNNLINRKIILKSVFVFGWNGGGIKGAPRRMDESEKKFNFLFKHILKTPLQTRKIIF